MPNGGIGPGGIDFPSRDGGPMKPSTKSAYRDRAGNGPLVAEYYADLTAPLQKGTGDMRLASYGLWGPETRTEQESLERSIHLLAEGCGLRPGMRVLDAGCGVGGATVLLARKYGVRITGLTNCEPHVAAGTKWAEENDVGHLADFRHGDFMDIPFPDATFDAVINLESFCYAAPDDRSAYMRGVRRALKPGGRWCLMETLLSGKEMSPAQDAVHVSLQRSCLVPPLMPLRDLTAMMRRTGLADIEVRDLDAEVAPFIESLTRRWKTFVLFTPPPKPDQVAYHELMQSSIDFGQGLREGVFTYPRVYGVNPGP